MPWEEVERCDGFRVVKLPARDGKPVLYSAHFRRQPKYTAEAAKQDGIALVEQVRLRVQQEQQQIQGRKAQKCTPRASPSGSPAPHCLQAPITVPAWDGGSISNSCSSMGMQARALRSAATAAGSSTYVSIAEAAAQVAAGTLALATCGALTGSLVKLGTCYHGGLRGKHLLLGRRIGGGGFSDVYEGSPVEVNRKGTIQACEVAAVATAAAGAVVPSDMLRFAVKVYRSSKPGVSSSKLKDFAAQELRALQLLRGCNEAVQLMAEGELVCRDSAGSSAAAGSFSPASSSKAASARADAGAASHSTVAAAAKSNSSAPYFSSCIVTELAQQTLRGVMQRVGVINEPYAQSVAIQLLKLLVVAHSGDLGFVIVHRDLNPQNILYFDSGRIAAADFGISHVSKVVETAAGAAAAPVYMDTAIGTAYYAAPDLCGRIERPAQPLGSSAAAGVIVKLEDGGGINISSSSSNGSRRGYDASVDVFAVGVIVLEMLVGKLGGLFKHGALTLSQLLLWEQQVRRIVDGEVQLPAGVVVSPAALQFIGCCCGVGREREEAAARGEAKRLTPAVLLLHSPWLQ